MSKDKEIKEKFESVWKSGPIGKIVLTIALLFMGPIGWLLIICLWGYLIYSYNKNK